MMPKIDAFKTMISRRSLLKGAPMVVATAAAMNSLTPGEAAAQTKLPHIVSKYQDTPKDAEQCSNCSHFVAPASCAIVVDPIAPQAWCQFYAKA